VSEDWLRFVGGAPIKHEEVHRLDGETLLQVAKQSGLDADHRIGELLARAVLSIGEKGSCHLELVNKDANRAHLGYWYVERIWINSADLALNSSTGERFATHIVNLIKEEWPRLRFEARLRRIREELPPVPILRPIVRQVFGGLMLDVSYGAPTVLFSYVVPNSNVVALSPGSSEQNVIIACPRLAPFRMSSLPVSIPTPVLQKDSITAHVRPPFPNEFSMSPKPVPGVAHFNLYLFEHDWSGQSDDDLQAKIVQVIESVIEVDGERNRGEQKQPVAVPLSRKQRQREERRTKNEERGLRNEERRREQMVGRPLTSQAPQNSPALSTKSLRSPEEIAAAFEEQWKASRPPLDEEYQRRHRAQIETERAAGGRCVLCGGRLGWVQRVILRRHLGCTQFIDYDPAELMR